MTEFNPTTSCSELLISFLAILGIGILFGTLFGSCGRGYDYREQTYPDNFSIQYK
jgi:hypothetical protein